MLISKVYLHISYWLIISHRFYEPRFNSYYYRFITVSLLQYFMTKDMWFSDYYISTIHKQNKCILFIYDLFTVAVSSKNCIVWNNRIINE